MNEVKKEQNHTLNILKTICAILIVFNHCVFPDEFGKIVKDISRVAVPIFFMISGYYVYCNSEAKIKKKLKRIFLMFTGACIFWFVYTIIRYAIISPEEIKYYLSNFTDLKCIYHFFVFNDNLFWCHLWFLNALLYCYGIEFIKKRFKQENHYKIELLLAFLLLLGYLLIDIFVIDEAYSNAYLIRNFLFVGIPFFLIGKNIHHFNIDQRIRKRTWLLLFVISFAMLFVERIIYPSELYVSSIATSILLFIICLKRPDIKNSKLEYIGKNLNIYIYVFHPAIKYIILDIIDKLGFDNKVVMYIYPVITLCAVVVFSYLVYKLNKLIARKKRGNRKTCLVIGYMNNNFGDDLFFKILFDRYPNVDFYMFPPSTQLKRYHMIFEENENVKFYDDNEEYLRIKREINNDEIPINIFPIICEKAKEVDFFINIGGSIFIQNDNWKKDDRFVLKDIIKDKPSFIIGCNFGPCDKEYYEYYKKWFKKFDDICFREKESYDRFKDLDNARLADDIVLLKSKPFRLPLPKYNKTIGISVVDPAKTKKLKEYEKEYYRFMVSTIKYYIKKDFNIKMYSFCTNEGDLGAINKIISKLDKNDQDKIEIVEYTDNISEFIRSWKKCNYIIGTRLHSNIMAILCKQKFIPVVYSDKISNYLKNIDENVKIYDIKELDKMNKDELTFNCIGRKYNSKLQFKKVDEYLKNRGER